MAEPAPTLWVAAGPNGAGKSSIVGEMMRQAGAPCFDPDQVARQLRELDPNLLPEVANELAWRQGKRLLEAAIERRLSFGFETTLGGRTIPALLHKAADLGFHLKMWFLALESAELHLARVRARVKAGGHDIPEETTRARYVRSRHNLVLLLPRLAALRVYDNSETVGPGAKARLRLILDWQAGSVRSRSGLRETPAWARPIVAAALAAEKARQ